ncbi:MAG: DUF7009 family protein [Bacteroidia bacterium]|mgnify:FL=1|jgi:hypothetical protein|tara:strand:+ start:178 stop:543 length:366 start_codon:yes stop_codon:yes gene_type:complete
MKIRIKDNSVRYRLAQSEVTSLVKEGEVWSKCLFAKGELIYGITASDTEELSCIFMGNRITTKIPKVWLENWDTDERVGFEYNDDGLFVLIEKDWQCLKPREQEDESNLYANPGLQNGASV